MNLVKVKCAFCGKVFLRRKGQFNEAKKFGWKQYCSWKCLSRDKLKRQILFCENCGKRFERTPCGISPHNYCSQSCAAVVNNRKHPKRKRQIIINKRKICIKPGVIICTKCGKQFQGNRGKRYCSTECKRAALWTYTPQQLIKIIRKKAHELKRVPAKRELRKVSDYCVSVFGSWNNAVIAAGFQPNRSHENRMYKRIKTKAKDGHLCDSISEAIVDNWLTENRIFHQREAPYPETNHKADWVIKSGREDVFVEYFGLANDSPRYDRTVREKRRLCQKYKIRLIEIYHWDLYPKRRFEEKIKREFENLSNILISQGGETCTLAFRLPGPAS